jgi:membrane-bound metal-dependent hydrolase YbcI (DUF457 family)
MDVLHHTAIGAIGSVALTETEQPIAGMAFLLGSVLPDLDVAFMAFGKRTYLKNHQGATHSLLMSPILAAIVAGPLMLLLWSDWRFFVLALAAIWLHILLDACNTFGVAWLWPLSRCRNCLDAVFFIDLTAWLITGLALVAILVTRDPWVTVIYASVFAGYFITKTLVQRYGKRRFHCDLAIPTALHPLRFLVLNEQEDGIRTCEVNVVTGKVRHERFHAAMPEEYERLAEQSLVFCDMKRITRFLSITEVEKGKNEIRIVANDLGVRNFGGKFGQTVLRFDEAGNLKHEMANI